MKILFTTLTLPLGLLLAGLMVLVVVLVRGRDVRLGWKPVILSGLLLVFGWVVASPWFGIGLSHLISGRVQARELTNPQDADAIIVLTGGMFNAGPVGWLPKPEGIQRLAVAYELQRMINLRLPVIVSGGHTAGVQNPSEAATTAGFFANQRTEVTPTELEETSTDTYESAMQLAPILAKRGVHNALLVTDETHMLRALATFRARGVDAIPAPALNLPVDLGVKMYLPSVYGLGLTTSAMYEFYGLVGYLLTGKISFNDLTYNK